MSTAVEPHNIEAEETVLGACLIAAHAVDKAGEFLEPGHFYRESHGAVFAALQSLRRRDEPTEPLAVAAELERLGTLAAAGGKGRLQELAATVTVASNVGHYAALVLEAARSRTLYRAAVAIEKASLNGGVTFHPQLLDDMTAAMEDARQLPGEPALPPGPIFMTAHEFAASHFDPPVPLLGTDETAIIAAGSFNLLAGRPGTGKTTLVLDLVCHLAAGLPWPPADPDNARAPMPWPCPRPVRCALIVNEGPQEMFRAKVQDKLVKFPHSIREAGGEVLVQTFNWGTFSFADRSIYERVREELDRHEIDLVVGDPLASLGLEGVGSPAETFDFVNRLKPLGLGTNRAFLFLHHFRERVEKGEDEVQRISGAWGGHMDSLITLQAGAQANLSRLWYPKLRWNATDQPSPITLARILPLRSFEAIGEETDTTLLEPQIHAYLVASREGSHKRRGWQTADEIREGIDARRTAVQRSLEGASHLFRMVTEQGAKALGARSSAKLWGLVEWDTEISSDVAEPEEQGSFEPPADDIPF